MVRISNIISGTCEVCGHERMKKLNSDPETARAELDDFTRELKAHEAMPIIEGDYNGIILRDIGAFRENVKTYRVFYAGRKLDKIDHGRIYETDILRRVSIGTSKNLWRKIFGEKTDEDEIIRYIAHDSEEMSIYQIQTAIETEQLRALTIEELQKLNQETDDRNLEYERKKSGGTFRTLEE